jgi:Tfp pilus assembly protein FimT
MKAPADSTRSRRAAGFTLIECVVYISVATVMLGIASATCWRCWEAQRAIRRDAEDIVRALHTGEQWRADIRAATQSISQTDQDRARRLRIPTAKGVIDYRLIGGNLHRQVGATGRDVVVMRRIQSSRMQPDPRRRLTAWRWELELQPGQRKPRLRPRFTFEAVPGLATVR